MNDLEHDLRTLLEHKAAGAGAPEPDPRLLRRARRRQVGTVLGGALVATAIVAGVAIGIAALAPPDGHTPTEPSEPLVDTNVNGITVTHPESWYVVDPVEVGIEPASTDLPRLVLLVSGSDPVSSGTLGCPGLANGESDGFVLTMQQEPLALAGEGAQEWPVELVPLQVDTSDAGCYPGWIFRRASWTASGRTFEARVGVGPDVSDADLRALDAAFAGMRFAPTEIGPEAVVIATGNAGGEDWELIANQSDGFSLTLQWSSGGMGIGDIENVEDDLQSAARVLGEGDGRTVVVFGSTRRPITRVEAVPAGGGPVASAAVIDVPDPIGGELDAFVLMYQPDPADPGAALSAYDGSNRLVATMPVMPSPPGE